MQVLDNKASAGVPSHRDANGYMIHLGGLVDTRLQHFNEQVYVSKKAAKQRDKHQRAKKPVHVHNALRDHIMQPGKLARDMHRHF